MIKKNYSQQQWAILTMDMPNHIEGIITHCELTRPITMPPKEIEERVNLILSEARKLRANLMEVLRDDN